MDRKHHGKHHGKSAGDNAPSPGQGGGRDAERNLAEIIAAHNIMQSNPLALMQQMNMMAQAQQAGPGGFFGQGNAPYNNPAATWLYLDYLSRIQAAQQMIPGNEGQRREAQGQPPATSQSSSQQHSRSNAASTANAVNSGSSNAGMQNRMPPANATKNSRGGKSNLRQPPNKKIKLPADTDIIKMGANLRKDHQHPLHPPSQMQARKVPQPPQLHHPPSSAPSSGRNSNSHVSVSSSSHMRNHLPKESPPNVQLLKLEDMNAPLNLSKKSSSSLSSPQPSSVKSLPPAPHPMLKERDVLAKQGTANHVTIIPHAHTKPENLSTPPGKYPHDFVPKPAHMTKSTLYSHVIPKIPQPGMVPKPSNEKLAKKKTTVASLLAQSRVQQHGLPSDSPRQSSRSSSPEMNHNDIRASPTSAPHRPWMNNPAPLVIPTVKKPSVQPLPAPPQRQPRQAQQQKQQKLLNDQIQDHERSRNRERTPPKQKNQRSPSDEELLTENTRAPTPSAGSTTSTPASPADLAQPLKNGWKRETLLKGLGAQGLSGEVAYISPSGIKCKQISDVKKHLTAGLTAKMFSFSSRLLIGDFLLPTNSNEEENSTLKLSADQLANWLSSEGEENKKEEARQKEERERKKQHLVLIKSMEMHRRQKRRCQLQNERKLRKKAELMEQQAAQQQAVPAQDTFTEIDELTTEQPLPELVRVNGLHLGNQAFANLLQIYEFLHTFGETLGFDMDSLPSMSSLQKAFLHVDENEEELLSVMSHLLVCAVEDPGMSNPNKHITAFGQTLKQADITFGSLSEILKLYLEGVADSEPEANTYYEWLNEATFLALTPTRKSTILAFLCDLLLQNKAVLKHLESSTEAAHNAKKERQQNDIKVRRLRMLCARKAVAAASEQQKQQLLDQIDNDTKSVSEASTPTKKAVPEENGEVEKSIAEEDREIPPESTEKKDDDAKEEDDSAGDTKKEVEEKEEKEEKDVSEPSRSPTAPSTPAPAPINSVAPNVPAEDVESDDQLEETESDADAKLSIDEIRMKMNQLNNVNEKLRKQVIQNLKIIRSACLGQDRWRRRFWNLPNSGGVFIEGGSTNEFDELKSAVKEVLKDVEIRVSEDVTKMEVDKTEDEEVEPEVPPEPKSKSKSKKKSKKEAKEASVVEEVTSKPSEDSSNENEMNTDENSTQKEQKQEVSETETETEETVKKEISDSIKEEGRDASLSDIVDKPSVQFEVPPPAIKIFSFAPRTGCSGKVIEVVEPVVEPESDDQVFLNHIKDHPELWDGWWKLTEEEKEEFSEKLCANGVREKVLKNSLVACQIENIEELDDEDIPENVLSPEQGWDPELSYKVHVQLLEGVETLEERVGSASLQVKGWTIPTRKNEHLTEAEIIEVVKERLLELESAVERRYLKPPLGKSANDISLSNLTELTSPDGKDQRQENYTESRALMNWRDGLTRAKTPGVLSMALYTLDSSIAWEKSVMKASCQLCKGGDNEDKLLLCDSCDRGYHTYCFKPPMDQIPDGDWFCFECINKATGIKACIVCGKQGSAAGKLLTCDKCVKAYHTECLNPPLAKAPRGRWHCPDHRKLSPNRKRKSESSDKTPDGVPKQQKSSQKKAKSEANWCEKVLEELAGHEDAWPFLDPVNTRQFPTYKKIIKNPMDLATIRSKLGTYKSKEMFLQDVRLIFDNCETFNEDDSPVGKAGHSLRVFFESKLLNSK